MPKRVTPEEVREMYRLYEIYGNCAEVARRMDRSASTVARYIRGGRDAPQALKHAARQAIGK